MNFFHSEIPEEEVTETMFWLESKLACIMMFQIVFLELFYVIYKLHLSIISNDTS